MHNNYNEIKQYLDAHQVKLIAVSKTKPVEMIQEVFANGQMDFGENRVQELSEKATMLPKEIRWHMIGHLQKNKVKYIAPFIHLIHSVDSVELLAEINKQAVKNNRIIPCLLQIHIAEEETKFGFDKDELLALFNSNAIVEMKNVRIDGLMGMATLTNNQEQIRKEFRGLKMLFEQLKKLYFQNKNSFTQLSMGMSSDYIIAVEEGATMVRIGSLIFGERH